MLDFFADSLPAEFRRYGVVFGEALGFCSEVGIFDRLDEPTGDVAIAEMMHPRFIIDAFRHLQKHAEVLCPQIQLPLRTSKIE